MNCDSRRECKMLPAIGKQMTCDFTKGPCDVFNERRDRDVGVAKYDKHNGATFVLKTTEWDTAMISTSQYMFFGRVELEMRAALGKGLEVFCGIGSISLDQADLGFRLRGAFQNEATTVYDTRKKGLDSLDSTHKVSNITTEFRTYAIEWTEETVTWFVDGEEIRVEYQESEQPTKGYLHTPMKIFIGFRIRGLEFVSEEGMKLVGGKANMSEAPFAAQVRSVSVIDYAGGNETSGKNIKSYLPMDGSGRYDSIEVIEAGRIGKSGNGLGSGSIVGIVVGALCGIGFAVAAYFIYRKRHHNTLGLQGLGSEHEARPREGSSSSQYGPLEMDGAGVTQELDSREVPVELESIHFGVK